MHPEERRLREELAALARTGHGRRLLQLSLRSLEEGSRGLTAGCWSDRGIAGCLFQHAYWQGVKEGLFEDRGRPGDWIGGLVGSNDYGTVLRAIEAFDDLGKRHFATVSRRRLMPDRRDIRTDEWGDAVERILIDTLSGASAPDAREPAGAAG
jgi:hypothetical protein